MYEDLAFAAPAAWYLVVMMCATLVLAVINCSQCCKPPSGEGTCVSGASCSPRSRFFFASFNSIRGPHRQLLLPRRLLRVHGVLLPLLRGGDRGRS